MSLQERDFPERVGPVDCWVGHHSTNDRAFGGQESVTKEVHIIIRDWTRTHDESKCPEHGCDGECFTDVRRVCDLQKRIR